MDTLQDQTLVAEKEKAPVAPGRTAEEKRRAGLLEGRRESGVRNGGGIRSGVEGNPAGFTDGIGCPVLGEDTGLTKNHLRQARPFEEAMESFAKHRVKLLQEMRGRVSPCDQSGPGGGAPVAPNRGAKLLGKINLDFAKIYAECMSYSGRAQAAEKREGPWQQPIFNSQTIACIMLFVMSWVAFRVVFSGTVFMPMVEGLGMCLSLIAVCVLL